jgi:hypothetical protein
VTLGSPMQWITLPPAWVPVAELLFVACCALWTGTLLSVSWLTGRARMMADGPEVGALALALFRRWATPLLVASLVIGIVWLGGGPRERLRAHWVYGIGAAVIVLLMLHGRVGTRAERVGRGSLRAINGEWISRVAIVISFGAIIALAALHTSFVP